MSARLFPIVDIAISMSPDTGPSMDGCLLDTARVSSWQLDVCLQQSVLDV